VENAISLGGIRIDLSAATAPLSRVPSLCLCG